VAIEKFSTVRIITVRRPTLSAIQPQNSEPSGAPMPDESRIARTGVGQLPAADK